SPSASHALLCSLELHPALPDLLLLLLFLKNRRPAEGAQSAGQPLLATELKVSHCNSGDGQRPRKSRPARKPMTTKVIFHGPRSVRLRYVLAGTAVAVGLIVMVGLLAGLLRPPCPEGVQPTAAPTSTKAPGTSSAPETPETTTGQPATPDPAKPWLRMRLPEGQRPRHYRVRLHPRLGDEASQGFTGEVDIDLRLLAATKYILVHVKYLSVTNTIVLNKADSQPLPLANTFNYTENQFWVIELASELPANSEVQVQLQYRGGYFGIVGLYQSTYTEGGVKKFLATTKFQPTDARKAFPCLDEPQLKATYTAELVHQPEYTALANMPQLGSRENYTDNLVLTRFQETRNMSTYLFCILISQFASMNTTSAEGDPFRVWAPQSLINQSIYALESGVRIQDFFSSWFNYSYESQFPKQVVTVVAHELAHMWFGNLVTMVWWNDLWLNEGFASYFADIGADLIEPSWELRQQGFITTYISAFNADDVITSHPIIVDVETPQEITQIFDTITYSKGQAVLTQLEDFMGMDNFQLGLQDYLKANEFGVASTPQLYESLQKYSADNVTEFMDRWTRQMGFPLVTVAETADPDVLLLNQTWFLREPATRVNATASPFSYQWIIKLSYSSQNGSSSQMMRDQQMRLTVPGYRNFSQPLKFNLGQQGFYRVNYPDSWWHGFADALRLNVTVLSAVDRAGLISDAFALANSNQLGYAAVVKLLSYMASESHYLPWYAASSGLGAITRQLARRATYGAWSEFVRNITAPLINSELRQIVYTYGLLESDTQAVWDFMWQRYLASDSAAERERLLRALAMSRNAWLVNRLLDFSLDRDLVRRQDFVTLIGYIGANPNALEILWNWCRLHWDSLLKDFGPEDRRLGAMVPGFARQFNDEFHLAEYEAFIRSTEAGAGENARQTTLGIIRTNIRWLQDNEAELINALG
uniref:Aminopeptidase n=1 Tax=Macrostomum lignano TaxID=282301 RepID=A0A1I8I2N5_9PLAT